MPDRRIALLNLARTHLGPLTESDRKLFYAVVEGREADFRSNNPDENNLDQADSWGSDRRLRAESISWLCSAPDAREYLSNQGLAIHSALIEGDLDLSYVVFNRSLGFVKCVFSHEIRIYQTQLRDLIFVGSKVISINAAFSQIDGIVYLGEGFEAQECVNLKGAFIRGQILCTRGKFNGNSGQALSCTDAKITGNVWLDNDFQAYGTVDFSSTTITGQLVCRNSKFCNAAREALVAESATIGGGVSLDRGFVAQGKVSFAGATIGGQLICSEGLFHNPDGDALFLQGTTVTEGVDLTNGFNAQGRVSFSDAVISGQISCSGGKFSSFTNKEAFTIEDAIIKSSLCLDNGFTVIGAVSCCNARIDGTLTLKDIDLSSLWSLDLRGAKIGTLNDQMKSWPPPSLLYLNGLTYTTIDTSAPLKSKERLIWLRLQPEDDFSFQPYEQLATVLRNSGHEAFANEILIAKQDDRRKYGGLTRSGRIWNWFLGFTIGHGYRPHRALGFSLIFLVAGTILFSIGKSQGLISPSGVEPDKTVPASISDDYPMFSAPMYSLDAFLPIIDLHQESKWLPNANKGKEIPLFFLKVRSGQLLLWYFWVHILAGWILTTLWVAGFTGLIRNQR